MRPTQQPFIILRSLQLFFFRHPHFSSYAPRSRGKSTQQPPIPSYIAYPSLLPSSYILQLIAVAFCVIVDSSLDATKGAFLHIRLIDPATCKLIEAHLDRRRAVSKRDLNKVAKGTHLLHRLRCRILNLSPWPISLPRSPRLSHLPRDKEAQPSSPRMSNRRQAPMRELKPKVRRLLLRFFVCWIRSKGDGGHCANPFYQSF